MKKALIDIASNRFMAAVGPMNPDIPGQPITRETAFPIGTPGCKWVDCDDDVTPQTHDFDGQAFVRKPPQPAPPATPSLAEQIAGMSAADKALVKRALGL